jgi:hypothetical protein
MVADGRMPPARRIDRRRLWDIHMLDDVIDELPLENATVGTSWDDR